MTEEFPMKMTVLYYSVTGNTKKMAEVIAQGMMSVEGVAAKAFSIDEIDEAWIRESKCVVLGTPTYTASMCAAVKDWLDKLRGRDYGVPGKIAGAFATADYVHGGGDIAIQGILDHLLVRGMLAYSGGGALGKPGIHLGPVALTHNLDEYSEIFQLYGKRMASKTVEIFRPGA